jgi:hypothetical protein
VQHWRHVIFSDESRFVLYPVDGRLRVRRLTGEHLLDECVQETVAYGGGSVHIWGAIHHGGKTPVVILDRNVNARTYRDLLDETLIPHARHIYNNNFVYAHDNAPAHRARLVNDFLAQQEVNQLDWPAMSPDMNPIEHIWAHISKEINDVEPSPANLQELRDTLVIIWNAIPQQLIDTLIDGMPRRLRALHAARGGHTRF